MTTYTHLTNEELIRFVDNAPVATPLERELVTRLDELQMEINMLTHTLQEREDRLDELESGDADN